MKTKVGYLVPETQCTYVFGISVLVWFSCLEKVGSTCFIRFHSHL